MDADMQEILDLLKSPELEDRRLAMARLQNWKSALDKEDSLFLLELAGKVRPISDEPWDNPSEGLVNAACVLVHEEFVPAIKKHMLAYSISAINAALDSLLILHTEEALKVYRSFFGKYLYHAQLIPLSQHMQAIYESKDCSLTALNLLIEHNAHQSELYIHYYYELLANALQNGYVQPGDYPLDREQLSETMDWLCNEVEKYNKDYSRAYCYEAWGDSYRLIRYRFNITLKLLASLLTDKELRNMNGILQLKDPFLSLYYIEIMWLRKLEIPDEVWLTLMRSNEVSTDTYRLVKKYHPDLLPKDLSYQDHFVKETADFYFFNHGGIRKFPTEVEMMGSFEKEDIDGKSLTYYIVRFRSDDPDYISSGWMRMLIGAYYTESLPAGVPLAGVDDDYSDFIEWDKKTYEEHLADFQHYLTEKHHAIENEELYYSYQPVFNRRNNSIAVAAMIASIYSIILTDWAMLAIPIVPAIWLLAFFTSRKIHKNVYVQLRGYYLDFFNFDMESSVNVSEIADVHIEKRPLPLQERILLFIPFKTKCYVFYGFENEELLCIPTNYLEEDFFFTLLNQQKENFTLQWSDQQGA